MKIEKDKLIQYLEKTLPEEIEVESSFKVDSETVELKGMLGHKPGTYTFYGPKENIIKIKF